MLVVLGWLCCAGCVVLVVLGWLCCAGCAGLVVLGWLWLSEQVEKQLLESVRSCVVE